MDLKSTQQLLTTALQPELDSVTREALEHMLVPNPRLNPLQAIQLYLRNLTGAGQRILANSFPVCENIVGEACFDMLARDYLWQLNASCQDLYQLGDEFPDFLQQQIDSGKLVDLDYLADLTRLELAWENCFYRAPSATDTQLLQTIVPQRYAELIAHTSDNLKIIATDYPLLEIWQLNRSGQGNCTVKSTNQRQYLAVYPGKDSVCIEPIDQSSYHFILACRNNQSLAKICQQHGISTEHMILYLPAMLDKGWISHFSLPAENQSNVQR